MYFSMRTKTGRIFSAFMRMSIICTILLASLFLAFEADHVCSKDQCPVCAVIRSSGTIRQMTGVQPAACVCVMLWILTEAGAGIYRSEKVEDTLITRKVRMND